MPGDKKKIQENGAKPRKPLYTTLKMMETHRKFSHQATAGVFLRKITMGSNVGGLKVDGETMAGKAGWSLRGNNPKKECQV